MTGRPSFLPEAEWQQLLANGQRTADGHEGDPMPVVKLFTPDAGATWLLTEVDPIDTDQAFGLCDLGLGSPELGYVSLAELGGVRGRLNLPIERDQSFTPDVGLGIYAARAHNAGRIVA